MACHAPTGYPVQIKGDFAMYHRRSIRWQDYDYTASGAYFVTICTHAKTCLFGEITDGMMSVNEWGEIAKDCWSAIPEHFPITILDAFVVMPNHFHSILVIKADQGMARHASTNATPLSQSRQFAKPIAQSLPTIVGAFKSAVTKRINRLGNDPSSPIWQRNYHEHIIRDHERYEFIRAYIETNPQRWAEDSLYSKS
jgi:putative transposase